MREEAFNMLIRDRKIFPPSFICMEYCTWSWLLTQNMLRGRNLIVRQTKKLYSSPLYGVPLCQLELMPRKGKIHFLARELTWQFKNCSLERQGEIRRTRKLRCMTYTSNSEKRQCMQDLVFMLRNFIHDLGPTKAKWVELCLLKPNDPETLNPENQLFFTEETVIGSL